MYLRFDSGNERVNLDLRSILYTHCDWSNRSSISVQQRRRVVSKPQHFNKVTEHEVLWFIGDINLLGCWQNTRRDNKSLVFARDLVLPTNHRSLEKQAVFCESRYFQGCFSSPVLKSHLRGGMLSSLLSSDSYVIKFIKLFKIESLRETRPSRERHHANYLCLIKVVINS